MQHDYQTAQTALTEQTPIAKFKISQNNQKKLRKRQQDYLKFINYLKQNQLFSSQQYVYPSNIHLQPTDHNYQFNQKQVAKFCDQKKIKNSVSKESTNQFFQNNNTQTNTFQIPKQNSSTEIQLNQSNRQEQHQLFQLSSINFTPKCSLQSNHPLKKTVLTPRINMKGKNRNYERFLSTNYDWHKLSHQEQLALIDQQFEKKDNLNKELRLKQTMNIQQISKNHTELTQFFKNS